MSAEFGESVQEYKFGDVIEAAKRLARPSILWIEDEEFYDWNSRARKYIDLSSEVSGLAGVGDSARCTLVGDAETGLAFVLRSRYLLNFNRYGFYVQRESDDGLSVWHGPSRKARPVEWGFAMLDRSTATQASDQLARAFLSDIVSSSISLESLDPLGY